MKIIHIISSINPKNGGPIEGIKQFIRQYPRLGHQAEIVCLDEVNDPCVKEFNLVKVHALGPSFFKYGYSPLLLPWLKENFRQYDVVIVNGIWQYTSFAVWCAMAGSGRPYYVFTHGMLDPWFKKAFPLKHLKKWLYWPWAEYRVLRDARKVIFTCDDERLLARESFWLYKVNEAVTSYGISEPPVNSHELTAKFLAQYPKLLGKRIILFLSRIHVKKGCDLLVDAFSKVVSKNNDLYLVIAGPDQSGWSSKLQAQAEALGIADRIIWTGMLQGDMKWGAFYAAEVFSLPSHQENFGIVVAEALSCGKPVLISNKVNIWREIIADGAGLVSEDTFSGTLDILTQWLNMNNDEFAAMKAKTISCFTHRFHAKSAAERLLEILKEDQ